MTNSARLSGRPSSSAAYNVDDVVDTPDSAIKSWRYLGAGEWEPNDAVRYTMVPGGGIEVCVGDIRATIPELTAAQSAATLAAATSALTPVLTNVIEYVQGYYVKVGGTRTTGRSTPGDWSEANCYSTIQSALNQPWTADDSVVVDDGAWSMPVFSVAATTALDGSTLRFRSRSGDPEKTSLTFTDAAQSGFRFNRADRKYAAFIKGFSITRSGTHSGTHAAFLAITTPTNDVTFEDCVFSDTEINHPSLSGIRGFFAIGHNSATDTRVVSFRRVKFRNLKTTISSNLWFASSEAAPGNTIVLDDVDFENLEVSATSANGGMTGGFVGMHLSIIGVRINGLKSTHAATIETAHYPIFSPGAGFGLTIDGLEVRDVGMTGGGCGAFAFRAEGVYDIKNVRGYDCYSLPAVGANSVGGLCLVYGEQSTGTIEDVIAERCTADFGTLLYWSQGGSGTAKALVAVDCVSRVGGMVYSGGWGDCSADGVVGIGCQYGSNPYNNPVSPDSGFFHGHNHPSLATRAKTIAYRNARLLGCRNVSPAGFHTIYMHSTNATHALTAVVENIAADGPETRQIGLLQANSATFNLSGSVQIPGGAAAVTTTGIVGTLGVTGEVVEFGGVPTIEQAMAWARDAAGI